MKSTLEASHVSLPAKWGRVTGYQVAEAMDALLCIRTCCEWAFNSQAPAHFQKLIDALPTGAASLAKIRRTFALWRRYCGTEATLRNVQSFLHESRNL